MLYGISPSLVYRLTPSEWQWEQVLLRWVQLTQEGDVKGCNMTNRAFRQGFERKEPQADLGRHAKEG